MTRTPSTMIPLGTIAPDFNLLDTRTNNKVCLDDIASPTATVMMFICNHCPYVKLIQHKMAELAATYQAKGISFVAISSNDATHYPDDSPEMMRIEAENNHYTFPYLYDETQSVAKAYHAACTPDFYIFDGARACVYRGRFDDATPNSGKTVTGKDLSDALDAILSGKPVTTDQIASVGCNIKWKK